MHVFVTGASGWIGSAAVDELLSAGHEVTGLARSESSADALAARGVRVRRGDLDDLDGLRAGAAEADAVLHLANKHDFEHPEVSNRAERSTVEAITDVLAGSDRPFLLAAGTVGLATGRPGTEDDRAPFVGPDAPRGGSENLALERVEQGVRTVSVRFAPTVHGTGDHGFIAILAAVAKARGVSAHVDEGTNRWPAVHVSDAARLVRLGLAAPAGSVLHAVAEEGVPTRDIAAAIGRSLGLPVTSVPQAEAVAHFGWIGSFFALDVATSSTLTQQRLGWTPTGPTLLQDLDAGAYRV